MKFWNPDYKELSTEKVLKSEHIEIVHALICDKLNAINNNVALNKNLIIESLKIVDHQIHSYSIEEFVIINFDIVLFDLKFRIPFTIFFNADGKFKKWKSRYVGSIKRSEIMKLLNLDHFDDGHSYLEFHLDNSELELGYQIVKHDYIQTPMSHLKTVTLIYYFDNSHKVKYKKFKTTDNNTMHETIYSFKGFEKLKTERLFLMFVNHIIIQKESVDAMFFNYSKLDFSKPEWFKKVYNAFLNALKGDNIKLIEMMTI